MMMTDTAMSTSSEARSRNPNPTARKPVYSFHEPFVSPEFGARLRSGIDGRDRGERPQGAFNRNDATSSPRRQEVSLPQAAPLYTVSAVRATGGLLAAPATAISDPLLLGKGLPTGPASTPDAAGLKEIHFQPKSHNAPLPDETIEEVEAERQPQSSLGSPRDMSPLVAEAICTWGEELRTILGQDVHDSTFAKPRIGGRPMLTTTGLLPQIMTLRFSSPIRVASVHLRVSAVCRLAVDAGEGLLGWENGKTVTVPAGGSSENMSGRCIVVDVHDMSSFENTRSISVAIMASRRTFCSVHQIYALGVQV